MNAPRLVLRNLRRRPLATFLTGASVALGVALFAAVGALRQASEEGFQRTAGLCDTLVGAKGSTLELTLNALYHMGQSPGNVPYPLYQELREAPGVQWSVPLAVGDSFRGYRIVGVTDELFSKVALRQAGAEAARVGLAFSEGGPFTYTDEEFAHLKEDLAAEEADGHEGGHHHHDHGHEELYKVVLGADVARATGLGVGDSIVATHGVEGSVDFHEEAPAAIVGVLEGTGTPLDRAVYIPIGAYYVMEGHEPLEGMEEGGARDPRGLSGIMLGTKAGFYRMGLYRAINDRLDAQAVFPSVEVRKLFELVGTADQVLRWVSLMVVVVALLGVMVAIYNTMGARRREFAILRALGARRRTLLGLVMAESALLALLGGIAGLGLSGILVMVAGDQVKEVTGVAVAALPGLPELLLLGAVTLAGALAGLVPAISAYRTETAHALAAQT